VVTFPQFLGNYHTFEAIYHPYIDEFVLLKIVQGIAKLLNIILWVRFSFSFGFGLEGFFLSLVSIVSSYRSFRLTLEMWRVVCSIFTRRRLQ
jgi:hypothetical protein